MESKVYFITGATGLIGSSIVKSLLSMNVKIIAHVRSIEKARSIFGDFVDKFVDFYVGDIKDKIEFDGHIDYIIHAASQTSSKAFIDEPVETIMTSVEGTRNVLEFAKEKKVKSMIYLSSMEVYGTPETDEKIKEDHGTNLDTMNVRSSYSESKRLCEALCTAYYKEYDVPVKIIRLTQTFGPGVSYNDPRVFAEFARCAIENKEIVLKTKGDTKRSYLDIEDAVIAILTVLIHGENGEAYNAANENTYCSIYELANLFSNNVKIELEDINKFGYAPTLHMNLDTTKLRDLGWEPYYNLDKMIKRLIESMRAKR